MRPVVSVIVCVHNGGETILRQLCALDRQRDAPVFEIIIVDNASTDDTRSVVEHWLHDRPASAPVARLIDAFEKAHLPYARNQGALAASGNIFAFCDADDEADERWVAALSTCLHVRSGIVGGRVNAVTPHGAPATNTFPDGLITTHYLPHVPGANHALTRDCFIGIGGFDESLPRYGYDDVDISWRAQEMGFPIGYCGEAQMRFTLSTRSKAIRKQFLLAKGRVLIAQRHPDAYQPFALAGCVRQLFLRLVMLPYRMIRPMPFARSRHVALLINAVGNLAGCWTYGVRRTNPDPILLTKDDFA